MFISIGGVIFEYAVFMLISVDVFEEVRPLIVSVVDGFCVSLIAWGTTGSGKTYTMVFLINLPMVIVTHSSFLEQNVTSVS